MVNTPCFVYDIDQLKNWISVIKKKFAAVPLTFSVKANSFVIDSICNEVSYFEVCSPGELQICKNKGIQPSKIIYSGVMKEEVDIEDAIGYNVQIITAESKNQFQMISSTANRMNSSIKVILRISSDNQFGMDPNDIFSIIAERELHHFIHLYGFHYYSGTQKKKYGQIDSDIQRLLKTVETCEEKYGYRPELVEYGPGLPIEYFRDDSDDAVFLDMVSPLINELAQKVPLGIELGRFMVAKCGSYYTAVKDLKTNYDINYAILDGGIHQLKYHGQIMATPSPIIAQINTKDAKKKHYFLCGSLCTVADVLAKDVELQELHLGDVLVFQKCGAYSITETPSLFLSRDMPCVYLKENEELRLVRGFVSSSEINTCGFNADNKKHIESKNEHV